MSTTVKRFVALHEEAEALLNQAPAMDDCSKEENEIYCALSNLQNALFNAGYYKKPAVSAKTEADESPFEEDKYPFEHELEEYISSRREEFAGLMWEDAIGLRAKKPVLFRGICECIQEYLEDEDMTFDKLQLNARWMNAHVKAVDTIIRREAHNFYYGE